jgi:hypothetical protein
MKASIWLALVWMVSGWAGAAELSDVYTVMVPVKSQSASEQKAAIVEGFYKVLVRASGQPQPESNEYLREQESKASAFLQQYTYERTADDRTYPWRLKLVFDPKAIQRLLADAGLPVWSSTRPLGMIWLAVSREGSREIVAESSPFGLEMKHLARERALPLLLPLMDIEDTAAVEVTDVWGRFLSPVLTASMRYGADVVIVGRLYPRAGLWQLEATWVLERQKLPVTVAGKDPAEAVDRLLAEVARQLAARYGVLAKGGSDDMVIAVSGVNSLFAMASLETYLESLLPVRGVDVVSLDADRVRLRIRLASTAASVLESIRLDQRLQPLPVEPSFGEQRTEYRFQWLGDNR